MGSLVGKKSKNKSNGIISEDIMHKIDTMNDESDSDNQPYKAKRRSSLDESILFGEEIYNEAEESSDGSALFIILGVVLGIIVIVGVLCIALL